MTVTFTLKIEDNNLPVGVVYNNDDGTITVVMASTIEEALEVII